jgi:hypothetical protein
MSWSVALKRGVESMTSTGLGAISVGEENSTGLKIMVIIFALLFTILLIFLNKSVKLLLRRSRGGKVLSERITLSGRISKCGSHYREGWLGGYSGWSTIESGFVIVRLHVQNSNFFVESSGVPMSGISTLENALRSDFPSRAHSALRRTESLSPRLMLSSETERGGWPPRHPSSLRIRDGLKRMSAGGGASSALEEGTGERLAGAPGWPGKVCETGETSAERVGREKEEETERFRERERA